MFLAGSKMAKMEFSSKSVQKIFSLQGRYATALFSAAEKTKKIKEIESEVLKVKSFILKNREMQSFLENPSEGREKKKAVVVEMLSKQKYSSEMVNFFKVLADNGRLNDSLKIINCYEQLMKDYNSEINVKIIANQALPKETQVRLEELVQKKFISKDKKSTITWKIDEKLMGGFVIEIGDNVIDLSVATKASAITKELVNSI